MSPWENLEEFRARTHTFLYNSLDASWPLETRPDLEQKVAGDGTLRPYWGNTVVFRLPELERAAIGGVQKLLYRECSPILAERLEERTLHITLHDLKSGPPDQTLKAAVEQMGPDVRRLLREIREDARSIRLTSTAMFSMVNTSMVLGFEPEDEESCGVLMEYYQRFQSLVPLPYRLTPHVTLAYFRPGIHSTRWVEKLQKTVKLVGERPPIRLELTGGDLEYQIFAGMNHYQPG